MHENRLARCIAQFWLENPWRELTAGKNILPKFGLKILGGHELLWGWLLGVYHAPDEDLLGWADAACSTVVEIHSTDGADATLRDMQQDEDTAQNAQLMQSDALKQQI